jgi:hypothetical protein
MPGVAAHVWQAVSHFALQQTPSRQKPVAHSVGAPQVCPATFLQTPAASQLLDPEHVPGSTPLFTFEHAPGVIEQLSQVPVHGLSQHTWSTQMPVKHSAPDAQPAPLFSSHKPCASHARSPEHVGASSAFKTLEQVPTFVATAQLWHVPLQSLLQQTPSTQKPLLHWLLAEHPPLSFLGTHDGARQ